MAKPRTKLILSDLHLGFGPYNADGSRNLLEEFHYDRPFAELMEYYCAGDYARAEVELIFNGDILNHLHTTPDDPDCDLLTERVALERTQKILAGHPQFFDALAQFAQHPHRRIVYLMGNHDLGIAWPKVQQLLKSRIHPDLCFYLDCYETDGIHVEHGNRFFADNRVDLQNLYWTRGEAEPVLKMPWGSFFAIHFINALKKDRPYMGKVFPFKNYLKWALFQDTGFALRTIVRLIVYFLKLNFAGDPKRNFSLFDTWKILREFSFPLHLDLEAKKLLTSLEKIRFVGFGHTHHARYRQFGQTKEYINTGSWNDLIGLDVGSLGQQLRWTFAEVSIGPDGHFEAQLKKWKGSYRVVEDFLG